VIQEKTRNSINDEFFDELENEPEFLVLFVAPVIIIIFMTIIAMININMMTGRIQYPCPYRHTREHNDCWT
jgi:hypothetical protein